MTRSMIFCIDAPPPYAPASELRAFLKSIEDLPADDPRVKAAREDAEEALRAAEARGER